MTVWGRGEMNIIPSSEQFPQSSKFIARLFGTVSAVTPSIAINLKTPFA